MAPLEGEADSAVLQEDPRLWLDQMRSPAVRVRLDEADAHAVAVDRAQVDRAATVEGATEGRAVFRIDAVSPWRQPLGRQQGGPVGAVVQHLDAVEGRLPAGFHQQVGPER